MNALQPSTRHGTRGWKGRAAGIAVPALLVLSACAPAAQPAPTQAPVARPTDAPKPAAASPMAAASPSGAASPAPAAKPAVSPVPSPAMAMASPSPMAGAMGNSVESIKSAADLRTVLNNTLEEHVYLAMAATGSALGGRQDEFQAAAATLDQNSVQLSKVIGAAYGPQAEQAFLALWRAHIGFFVDYTQATAAKDEAKKAKAKSDLDGYRQSADAFFSGANENLPKGAVADLLTTHVDGLLSVIDAQAAQKPADAFAGIKAATEHTGVIGDALATATAKKFPDKFPGSATSKAAGLQSSLNRLLAGHEYLAGFATGAALGGRTPEYEAAAATLDQNSVELSQAIGSAYGAQAGQTFLALWRAHIGFFVDYTQGKAANDQAKVQKARSDLDSYRRDADAFFSGANENLPKGAVAELLGPHVQNTLAAIDAQAAKDYTKAYASLKAAADHMRAIADPLAAATAKKFPQAFPTS